MLRAFVAALILAWGTPVVAQELVVFAASSLTEAFEDLATAFESRHASVRIVLNFQGSSTLALQILQGAPADVFASANPVQMQRVVADGLIATEPQIFATNRLVVVAATGTDLEGPADLAQSGLRFVLAAPEVPVGAYAREALTKMAAAFGPDFPGRVLANLVSEEPNVRQASARVELGEVDAAIVYATDATHLDDVEVLDIPAPYNVIARYPIAPLVGGAHQDLAERFVDFVLSDAGQHLLRAHGFHPPE